jgi:uncharacterized membrane protein
MTKDQQLGAMARRIAAQIAAAIDTRFPGQSPATTTIDTAGVLAAAVHFTIEQMPEDKRAAVRAVVAEVLR